MIVFKLGNLLEGNVHLVQGVEGELLHIVSGLYKQYIFDLFIIIHPLQLVLGVEGELLHIVSGLYKQYIFNLFIIIHPLQLVQGVEGELLHIVSGLYKQYIFNLIINNCILTKIYMKWISFRDMFSSHIEYIFFRELNLLVKKQ